MEINVESIKALEPGKIYILEVLPDALDGATEFVQNIREAHDLQIILLPKGVAKFVQAPEGYEIVKKEETQPSGSKAEYLTMEVEMLEYLSNWADKKITNSTVEEIAKVLKKVYLSNQNCPYGHAPIYSMDEWASDPMDWPKNVPPGRFLAIAIKWKS